MSTKPVLCLRRRSLESDEVDELLFAVDIKFAIELLGMPTHSVFGQKEGFGYIALRAAHAQQARYLYFPL